jgi:hypothetical protein
VHGHHLPSYSFTVFTVPSSIAMLSIMVAGTTHGACFQKHPTLNANHE